MNTRSKLLPGTLTCALLLFVLGGLPGPLRAADSNFTDANWSSMGAFPGANGTVSALVKDGTGNLYIGGGFSVVGDVTAHGIAKWDGTNWTALATAPGAFVSALAVSGSDLYAAGYLPAADGSYALVARWDGHDWSPLGSGIGVPPGSEDPLVSVSALAVWKGELYVGGHFSRAGDVTAVNVAKWNGSNWSALGPGVSGASRNGVFALAVFGGALHVGGRFTTAGEVEANSIAKWDGSSWSALGSGVAGPVPAQVSALAVAAGELYAVGRFATAGDVAVHSIAKWDGGSWSSLGTGLAGENDVPPSVSTVVVSGSDLLVGGGFTTAGNVVANGLAKWDGNEWSSVGGGLDGLGSQPPYVSTLLVSGGDLYVGGAFTTHGDVATQSIARWDGSSWSALGPLQRGMNDAVLALQVWGDELYAAGSFSTAGGRSANRIAKRSGSGWSPLGAGITGGDNMHPTWVIALAGSVSGLYAGGQFTTAGDVAAANIAKWDGSNWSALGLGVGTGDQFPSVSQLALSGGDLYVGGSFTTAGGNPANSIAKWDGNNWTSLGSGLNGDVRALAVSGNNLYAAGSFTTAGGKPAKNIARWDGATWSPLGSGVDQGVASLVAVGSDLYAGGWFTKAGGVVVNGIAKWDGSTWSALGSGFNDVVHALAASGDGELYAGGTFTQAGGTTANSIARWNGSNWSALGSGLAESAYPGVSAFVVLDRDLYAGGVFTMAGGRVSPYVARAYRRELPTISVRRSDNRVQVFWKRLGSAGFWPEQADSMGPHASWVPVTTPIIDDDINQSVTVPARDGQLFFRLQRP